MPIPRSVNRCAGCGYIVPGSWTECRRCGAPVEAVATAAFTPAAASPAPTVRAGALNGLAIAPPPPAAPVGGPDRARPGDTAFGAPDDALIPGARPRGVVPDTMLPRVDPVITHPTPSTHLRWNLRTNLIALLAAAVVIAGVYSLIPSGKHTKQAPTILAARPPFAGIPTSLSDVVRIAAESARHTALAAVIDTAGPTGAPLTIPQLVGVVPDYQWLPGNEASTTNTVVSITSGQGIDVIAVSGTDHDICAYGRWSPTVGSDYVTVAHVTDCAATTAPTTGWSQLPGGDAQDLPSDDGS